ncbi:hypothetical protein V7S43_013410 [Phytophthora oleae]|uniref:Transmembrane protein 198 n=1 Tax=Phytophthora oleae TaxID=2107226 RepID=A0ABD3F5K8_9STRA
MLGVCSHSHYSSHFPTQVHLEPDVVAEFALLSGLVVCLFGFRLLRWLIFLSGFVVAGLITSTAFKNTFSLKTWVFFASWIGFFVIGVAGGCVALAFFPLGVFLMGLLFSYAFTTSLPYQMLPEDSSEVLIVVLLGGFLAWLLVRPFAIVSTSLMGSIAAVWGVGYFTGKYPSSSDIKRFHSHLQRSEESWVYAVPGAWWVYLALMLLLFAVGMTKQCRDAHKSRGSSHIGLYTGWRSSPNIIMP